MKTYTYKTKRYYNFYDLSEALGADGVFIPRTISDTDLEQLGVVVAEAEEPIGNIRARKIMELKRQRDAAEVEPVEYGGHLYDYDSKVAVRSNALHTAYRAAKAKVEAAQSKDEIDTISIN